MRHKPVNLVAALAKLRQDLASCTSSVALSAVKNEIDRTITMLTDFRAKLNGSGIEVPLGAIDEVLRFLDVAKDDDRVQGLLASLTVPASAPTRAIKPPRVPVQIEANLTNEQIRHLLQKDLSRSELAAVAHQRSVSVGKRSRDELRDAIREFIDRQDSYSNLRS